MPVQRLHHHRAVLAPEILDLGLVARDQRRRHQMRELRDEDLLGRVANVVRIVDDEHLRVDPLEQVRRGDVGEVERRILAHQHHVDGVRQHHPLRRPERRVRALDVLHRQRLHSRHHLPVPHREPIGRIVHQRMPPRLRLEQQRERGVARDLDVLDGVHLDGDA